MEREIPILYKRKEECCGCTACYAICPKEAISMVEDEEGFEYPQIDERPEIVELKERFGDLEIDTIIGKNQRRKAASYQIYTKPSQPAKL